MPTIEQIRRIMPHGTSMICGDAGIYNEVNWVVVIKPTALGFEQLRGKELVLADTANGSRLGITLPYLISSLVEQGASVLGVNSQILPTVLELAESLKLPILKLPPDTNFSVLEAQIATFIREEREYLYQKEQKLTKELMELALAGSGVKTILSRLKELSGRNVILLDTDFTPCTTETEPAPAGIKPILGRLFTAPPVSLTGVRLGDGHAGFLNPIMGKQGTEGFLLVTAPTEELQEADRVFVKAGALSIAIELSRQQAAEDVEDRFQVEMVESLLNGELPEKAIQERAGRLGLNLYRSYVVIAANVSGTNLTGPAIAKKTATILNGVLCHSRTNSIIILYPVPENQTTVKLRLLGKEIHQKLAARTGGKITIGIGRVYKEPKELRTSLQEAEHSLTIGKKIFGEGSVSFVGDLGTYRLLLSLGHDELKSVYRDSVGRLADYDEQHNSELLPTLEATLRHTTLARTAKVLHVHRNTLLYRLQRIQEIANLNLDDGETRLMLHLGLRAGEIIRNT